MEIWKRNRILRIGLVLGLGGFLTFCKQGPPNPQDELTSSGGVTGTGGRYQSADDLDGGDNSDDLDPTKFPPTTPCDSFPVVDPPCDEEKDLVVECNFGAGILASVSPRVNVDPSSILKLVLLPLDDVGRGEGGQGGSAGAPNLSGYPLSVSAPQSQLTSYQNDTFSLLGPGATLDFWIDPGSASAFLVPIGGGYDAQWGNLALMEGDDVLEQRRIFLFAGSRCFTP